MFDSIDQCICSVCVVKSYLFVNKSIFIKAVQKKKPNRSYFVFLIFQLKWPQIHKMFVSIPHNTPLIIGDRQKQFEDPTNELKNKEN